MKLFKWSNFLKESNHEQILPSTEDIKSYFIEFEDEDYLINIHVGEALDFRDIKNKSMVFEKQKFIRVELVPPNISDLSKNPDALDTIEDESENLTPEQRMENVKEIFSKKTIEQARGVIDRHKEEIKKNKPIIHKYGK